MHYTGKVQDDLGRGKDNFYVSDFSNTGILHQKLCCGASGVQHPSSDLLSVTTLLESLWKSTLISLILTPLFPRAVF